MQKILKALRAWAEPCWWSSLILVVLGGGAHLCDAMLGVLRFALRVIGLDMGRALSRYRVMAQWKARVMPRYALCYMWL